MYVHCVCKVFVKSSNVDKSEKSYFARPTARRVICPTLGWVIGERPPALGGK